MTKEEFQTRRTEIISNMLDNRDKYGIYPTTICFKEFDKVFEEIGYHDNCLKAAITAAVCACITGFVLGVYVI